MNKKTEKVFRLDSLLETRFTTRITSHHPPFLSTNTVEAIIKWNVDESAGSKKWEEQPKKFLHPGYSISIGFLECFILRIRYKSSVRDMDRWTEQISTTFSPKKPCFKSTRGISETPYSFRKVVNFPLKHNPSSIPFYFYLFQFQ